MGNAEPAESEGAGPLELVHGQLPKELSGFFIRNGPNPVLPQYGNPRYHEFDGDAMLHASDLHGGKGAYFSRFVETRRKALMQEKGRLLTFKELLQPDGTMLSAANTSLVFHAKKLLALYEPSKPYALSLPQLDTLGEVTYQGQLTHGMSAHPKVCPVTGELMFFGYEMAQPICHYGVANKDGQFVRSFAVPLPGGKPAMMHDMAITQNYSLLLEFPLQFDASAIKTGMPFRFNAESPSRFGLLPRHAKGPEEVRWFEAKSCYCFHMANAWEEGPETVKLVGCSTPNFSFNYKDAAPARLYEWTLDLKSGSTAERELGAAQDGTQDKTHIEFPVVSAHVVGQPARYIWSAILAGTDCPAHSVNGCLKFDLHTGRQTVHTFAGGRWGGECVFARTGQDEDSGYMLTYTFSPHDSSTELYIFDAKTMAAEPVAILKTPHRVPFGFHGTWVPRADFA